MREWTFGDFVAAFFFVSGVLAWTGYLSMVATREAGLWDFCT